MDSLAADFYGHGAYGGNLLATSGIGRQVVASDGKLWVANNGTADRCRILKNNGRTAQVRIESATDDVAANPVQTVWTITLEAGSRKVRVENTTTFPSQREVKSVVLTAHLRQWFFSGFFQQGVMQNIHDGDRGFYSASPLTGGNLSPPIR